MTRKSNEEKSKALDAEIAELEANLSKVYEEAAKKAREEVGETFKSLVDDLGKALNQPK